MIWRTEGQIKVAIGFTGVVERADLVGVERDRVTFFVTVVGGVGSNMGNTREDKNSEDYKGRRVAKVSHLGRIIMREKGRCVKGFVKLI